MASAQAIFHSSDLGSGLRLHLYRTRAFKTVAARLAFHARLDGGTAARALVPRILARGTKRLPSLRDIQVQLDRLYGASLSGDARKFGERHVVQFRADWVHDRLAGEPLLLRMADLLAEFLHEPAEEREGAGLRASAFAQERKILRDEAASVFDDKARYARHRLVEEMCREEPFARPSIGRLAEIEALTLDDAVRAHRDLVERAPAELFLVGDLSRRDAERFARRLGLHRRTRLRRPGRTVRRRPARVRTVRERQDVTQAKLEMGFRSRLRLDGPLYPAFVLMNALFGGTPVGKLFKEVRERASLCYSIHSVTERTKGLLLVHAGIEAGQAARARRLILHQLSQLREGRFTSAELEMARGILVSALTALRDVPGGLIDFALERAVNGLPADLEGVLRGLEQATAAQVARSARAVELDTVYLLEAGKGAAKA